MKTLPRALFRSRPRDQVREASALKKVRMNGLQLLFYLVNQFCDCLAGSCDLKLYHYVQLVLDLGNETDHLNGSSAERPVQ